jgi:C_GCAxxG_C_C family probable redox protein
MSLPTNKPELAEATFKQGFNCAQSVLFTYAGELGLPEEAALKIATGFGAGMGRTQEVCGAVSGALMVIGMLYGRGKNDGREKTPDTYLKVQQFIDAFNKVHGTIICRDLLPGCRLITEQGQAMFREQGLIDKCYGFVRTACTILDDAIAAA